MGDIMKDGHLLFSDKPGREMKKRFVKATKTHLLIFKDSKDSTAYKSISLEKAVVGNSGAAQHCFAVSIPPSQVFFLGAQNKEQLDEWMKVMGSLNVSGNAAQQASTLSPKTSSSSPTTTPAPTPISTSTETTETSDPVTPEPAPASGGSISKNTYTGPYIPKGAVAMPWDISRSGGVAIAPKPRPANPNPNPNPNLNSSQENTPPSKPPPLVPGKKAASGPPSSPSGPPPGRTGPPPARPPGQGAPPVKTGPAPMRGPPTNTTLPPQNNPPQKMARTGPNTGPSTPDKAPPTYSVVIRSENEKKEAAGSNAELEKKIKELTEQLEEMKAAKDVVQAQLAVAMSRIEEETARNAELMKRIEELGGEAEPVPAKKVVQVLAGYDREAEDGDELSIHVGDIITVTKEDASGWWEGECNGKSGMFPFALTTLCE